MPHRSRQRTSLKQPILRFHGGNFKLAPWILSYFPEHQVYIEPFGGDASVLLMKERSAAEVYNDLDADIVNLFRVARDQGDELRRALEMTPISRDEFNQAWENTVNPIERARRTVIRAGMGRDSASATQPRISSFRACISKSGNAPASADWRNYPGELAKIIERLRGVVIENQDAADVMRKYDADDALHFVDPPYPMGAKGDQRKRFRYELDGKGHEKLLLALLELRGAVVIRAFDNEMYRDILRGWEMATVTTRATDGGGRVECLWIKRKSE
jgi:DNA adenine methylase